MYIGMHYVDGKFFVPECHTKFRAVNPATEEAYGEFANATPKQIQSAVQCASKAFKSWSLESRVKRADHFDRLAQLVKRDHDKLRDAISIETGKNLNESHAEVVEALHMCQYAAAVGRQPFGECVGSELPGKDSYVIRKPRGVVAVISPWNFPLAIGSFWCAAPAIVEGNTVVHKPSELTPMVNQIAAELYHEAGFPPGVYNLIHGGAVEGKCLVDSWVDVVLFTGSAEVGKKIRQACAETDSKTCSIECGSKSAMMIFADGDFDLGIDVSIASAFKLSGQRCVSSGRILVQRNIFEKFVGKFVKEVRDSIYVADPFDNPALDAASGKLRYGPMISKAHMEDVCAFNEKVRHCAKAAVLYDPDGIQGRLTGKGHFLRPFVYTAEWQDTDYLMKEVFGPHVAIVPFDEVEDAIEIYNDTAYGLALGAVTDDYRKHRKLARECTAGMLYINGSSIGAESHLPFSSWKKSGFGASAAATYKAVTHTMSVTVNYDKKFTFAQGLK